MTQNARILKALKAGKKLTPLAALRDFGCFRLAARIAELRGEGHAIRMSKPKGKRYAAYSL